MSHWVPHSFGLVLQSKELRKLLLIRYLVTMFCYVLFCFVLFFVSFRLDLNGMELLFLDVSVTRTEQGFRSSVYRKPTFTGQYLNFNSHRPYTVKKGIVRCLQHRAKTISSDTDAYPEEMISLRHNLHCNNYPERITSAPRNLDRTMKDNTWKLTTVCLPYVKGLAERIQKMCSLYDIRTVFTSGSTLRRYLFWVKPPTEFNMTKNCVFSIPCSWDRSPTKSKARRTSEGCSTRWD